MRSKAILTSDISYIDPETGTERQVRAGTVIIVERDVILDHEDGTDLEDIALVFDTHVSIDRSDYSLIN